jgi:pyrimidine operon attenuation protein/uracil phosphoribosyltransferase
LEDNVLLSSQKLSIILQRLAFQLYEKHGNFNDTVIIGLQPRGVNFARMIWEKVSQISGNTTIPFGELDTTFHRDDFRRGEPLIPKSTKLEFLIEDKNVVLIDDVLYTGRSVRAAMDALTSYGRPTKVELMVLVDRRYSRELPIEPDFVGSQVDTRAKDKVKVFFNINEENKVLLITDNE